MRKILFIIIGMLLLGANVYAQGNLEVSGDLGVGTTPGSTSTKVAIASADYKGLETRITYDSAITGAAYSNIIARNNAASASDNTLLSGFTNIVGFKSAAPGTNDITGTFNRGMVGGSSTMQLFPFNPNAPITIGYSWGYEAVMSMGTFSNTNDVAIQLTEAIDFYSRGFADGGTLDTYTTINSFYHFKADNFALSGGPSFTNHYGLFIEKMGGASNNYGIVLDGYGGVGDYGAALVFGENQNVQLYAKADGKLWISDGITETQHSPHDPVTGEWIFHSRNLKTGKVVRVNMEKLVKAVERITGETFMIETFEEVQ